MATVMCFHRAAVTRRYASPTTNLNDKFARTTMASLPSRDRIKNIHVYR